jgi:glutamate 5-kinase
METPAPDSLIRNEEEEEGVIKMRNQAEIAFFKIRKTLIPGAVKPFTGKYKEHLHEIQIYVDCLELIVKGLIDNDNKQTEDTSKS